MVTGHRIDRRYLLRLTLLALCYAGSGALILSAFVVGGAIITYGRSYEDKQIDRNNNSAIVQIAKFSPWREEKSGTISREIRDGHIDLPFSKITFVEEVDPGTGRSNIRPDSWFREVDYIAIALALVLMVIPMIALSGLLLVAARRIKTSIRLSFIRGFDVE